MSGSSVEWLLIALFFGSFFAFTFAEAAWLQNRAGTSYGKAFVGALMTNILAITVGYGFSVVLLLVLLMLAFGGSLESIGNAGLWVVVAIGILFPLVILALSKRLMIKILQLSDSNPWLYAIAASIGFFIVTLGSVGIFAYFR